MEKDFITSKIIVLYVVYQSTTILQHIQGCNILESKKKECLIFKKNLIKL